MVYQLSQRDIDWVLDRYPNMEYDKYKNEFFGELYFNREYNGVSITDAYSVRVFLNAVDKYTKLPKVICESSKIKKIAEKYKISISDLHINPDQTFCLAIEGEEQSFFKNGFTIQEFFKNAVEGFLFQISYYNKYGHLPWGEYAHGYLGYIEKFAKGTISLDKLFQRISKEELSLALLTNRQSKCLCGKSKKLRKCHPLIFKGINKMKIEIHKLQSG